MAYNVGGLIQAADFVGLRGSIGPDSAYANALDASNKLAALIGVGFGNRGYGQTSTSFPSVSAGDTVAASEWNAIINVVTTLNTHTGSALTLPSVVSAGATIQAFDGTLGRPNLPTLVTTLDTNRLLYSLADMTLTAYTPSVRTTPWLTQVVHEFTLTWASENAARYFFNAGGQIYVAASRVGGSSTNLNAALTAMLSQMGTIRFGAESTTYTGSGGTAYSVGYYDLTGSYQDCFYHAGPTFYSAPNYLLRARAENIAGVNGGNGTVVRFRSIFETGLPASYDVADGTLTSSISELKATGVLTIPSPTFATVTPL